MNMDIALGNPVPGIIHPTTWARPSGNTEMKVTQDAASHVARGGPPALDIGDGDPDLDVILAPHDAVIAQALTVGSANLSGDCERGGKRWRWVLAHNTLPHPVVVGQQVTEGQAVGKMGKTSIPTMPVPIHLHIQLGYWNGTGWTWVDPWPYLRQNGATEDTDMIPIPTANYKRIANKKTSLKYNGNFRDERRSGTVLKTYPAGTVFYPMAYANDGDVPAGSQSGEWFYGILYDDSPAGYVGGWFHSSLLGPLTDDVTVSTGYTQDQFTAAVAAAKKAGRAEGIDAARADLADLT